MDTSPSASGPQSSAAWQDADPTPKALMAEFPGWRVFQGVNQLWYARRTNTSPPVTCREENTVELRAQMRIRQDEIDAWNSGRS